MDALINGTYFAFLILALVSIIVIAVHTLFGQPAKKGTKRDGLGRD
jgi:hypothetical protein